MSDSKIRQGGLSRRQVLQWILSAGAATVSGVTQSTVLDIRAGSLGYGNDPMLIDPPRQPWPKILLAKQVTALSEMVDTVLPARGASPAASEVGVVMFFEEWVSAPYPQQREDRALLLPLIDRWCAGSRRELQSGEPWERFRVLAGAAYYTTPVGMHEMGFVGNVPRPEFKGPPTKVLKILDARYKALV